MNDRGILKKLCDVQQKILNTFWSQQITRVQWISR
jgi:hypothetical protein